MFNEARLSGKHRLSSDELQAFTGHLALLMTCGFPLSQILEILSLDEGPLQPVTRRLALELLSGSSLSEAMWRQPESFPENYVHVVRIGETSGRLSMCLERLSETLEQRNQLAKLVFQLLIYPATLILVCGLLMAFAVYGIFPMIIKVAVERNSELPWLTQALINFTSGTSQAILASSLLLAGWLLVTGLRHRRYGPVLRTLWETFSPLGRFQVQTRLVICLRQLALLMECGIDLMHSLRLLKDVAKGSILLENAFFDIFNEIREGKTLAQGFAKHDVFPIFLTSMVLAGEESATTHTMLCRVADAMEEDLYRRARTLASLVEPVLIGGMGIGVGTVLLATLLPIYQLVNF